MKSSEMKVGMHVTISHDISKTKKNLGFGTGMEDMIGNIYKIDEVKNNDDHGLLAKIRDFSWLPDDLTEVSIETKPQPFHFDVEELII